MRKIIGIGETILDIIFKDNQPTKANPGGSVFNCMVSLGRLGLKPIFLSEVGRDLVGDMIISFMEENEIESKYIDRFYEGKSPIAMAFLDQSNNASYQFYTAYPKKRLNILYPKIEKDDILIFGSIYSLRPELREKIVELLEFAKTLGAIIYYDPNFRSAHAHEAIKLLPTVIENLEYADIVRGSDEDFESIFQMTDIHKVYKDKVRYNCPNFICTQGGKGIELFSKELNFHYDIEPITPVSTIGAGDNFNAGMLYGLIAMDIKKADIDSMTQTQWQQLLAHAVAFSKEVCGSYENYISKEYANNYRKE